LEEGVPAIGSVSYNEWVYFKFNIKEKDTSILVSLTDFDEGENILVVCYKNNPTKVELANCWNDKTLGRGQNIFISSKDFSKKMDMNGDYYLGVLGKSTFESYF